MATFIVTNSGAPGGSGLTFEQAVQESILNAGLDTIVFAVDVTEVELDDAVTISGELIIDGDHNDDGISDVVFDAVGDHRHLTIDATAAVTIRNVDFVGGFDRPKADDGTYLGSIRLPAAGGTAGAAGALTDPTYVFDGADAGDGGDGTDGTDGVDGLDAAGSILNRGSLTLERVGFGDNDAWGERGQDGGFGGSGGTSQGGDVTEQDHVDGLINTGFGLDEPYRQFLLEDAHEGGEGGTAGRGGNGANGGDGGDGGDAAAAILNEGTLTLIDTVFAGRLTSGEIAGGNDARSGRGGNGGGGGRGGDSFGGDGGQSGKQWFSENDETHRYTWDFNYDEGEGESPNVVEVGAGEASAAGITIYRNETSAAGAGGDAGIAGNGGTGGRGGNSGDAATIINRGTLEGKAALAGNLNSSEVQDAGAGGVAPIGGRSEGGKGGLELGEFLSMGYSTTGLFEPLDLDYYTFHGTTPPQHILDIWALSPYGFGDLPDAGVGSHYTQEGYAADGLSLPPGTGGTAGQPGLQGTGTMGAGGDGTTALQTNGTLVYVYDLGQDEDTGQLAFNIIRLGNIIDAVTVHWELTGNGTNPLSAEDFAPGTQFSGEVSFAALNTGEYPNEEAAEAADLEINVRKVVFDIALDGLPEPPEGYRFTLSDASGAAVLGTSAVTGTVVDAGFEPPPVNEHAPAINSNGGGAAANVSVAENTTVVATVAASDDDGDILTYTILAGGDGALFKLHPTTHALSFKAAPDFEAPKDANKDNIYDVTVRVSDGAKADTQTLHVSVTDIGGVTIVGSKKNDKIDASHTPKGQPLPTNEEDTIAGGKKNDTIFGLGGDDTLSGGTSQFKKGKAKGANKLTGGDGADGFLFDTKLKKSKTKVMDFDSAEGDTVLLASSIFKHKKLKDGDISAKDFKKLFDYTKGVLKYDGDEVAKFAGKPDLDADDLLLV
ncbi:MAG: cadherin repeat domain-containing protein [Bauldia litoralis]